MGALVASGPHSSGHPAQSLYVLLQEVGSLQCSPMDLPSFGKSMVFWVFAPYLGPMREFGSAAWLQNHVVLCSGSSLGWAEPHLCHMHSSREVQIS